VIEKIRKQGWLRELRAMVRPDIRQALDGFALFFAITLFFCLLQAAHDGITKRQRAFDNDRWWVPFIAHFERSR
jgi:hypothetical protein